MNAPATASLFDEPAPVGLFQPHPAPLPAPSVAPVAGNVLTLPRREWERVERTPHWYQRESLEEIAARFNRGSDAELLVLPTGCGKCLGKDTPVLMFDGTVKLVQNVSAGDLLMGPDSTPRTVISLAHGEDRLYRVTPTKGDPYVVNEAHILSLKITGGAKMGPSYPSGMTVNISVRDYLDKSNSFKHVAKGWRARVDWPAQPVALEPYFLGLWLADGNATTTTITKPDPEIYDYLVDFAARHGCRLRSYYPDKRCQNHSVVGVRRGQPNPILSALQALNVIGNKHIPHEFKANSREVRRQLLAGFLDGDGCLAGNVYDSVSVSERLANDVAFVARSLGLAAYVRPCQKTCTNTGATGTYWRISISGHTNEVPVRIERRKATPRQQVKDVTLTGIRVEPIGRGEYFGFEIDGDRHFLLGDFTVTHNTFVASLFIQDCLSRREPVLILCNRDKLIRQMDEDLRNEGVFPLIEQADRRALQHFHAHGICVLASVQTLRGARLQAWPRDSFRWIVSDEAHNVCADAFRSTVEHFTGGGAKHLGLTATPYRSDNKSLKDDFAFPWIRKLTLRQAIEQKFLARLKLKIAPIEPLDLRRVGVVGRDFDAHELDRLIWQNTNLIASCIKKFAVRPDGTRRATVGFTPHVPSADGIANALRDIGISASGISWKSEDVDGLYERFRPQGNDPTGDLAALLNVSILAEGYNAPWIECVCMARPTLSLGVVTQQLGRGTRTRPLAGKTDCLILEIPAVTDKNGGLQSCLDAVLDGAEEDEKPDKETQDFRGRVRVRAKELLERETETDLLRAHDRAKSEVEASDKAERERIRLKNMDASRARHQEVEIRAEGFTYDPFDGINKTLVDAQRDVHLRPATDEQKALVRELAKSAIGARQLDAMSFEAAEALVQKLETRAKFNYASEPQRKMMIETLGCNPKQASRMKRWEATAWIDNRRLEMLQDLEASGHDYAALSEEPVWKIATLHKKEVRA